MTSIRKQKLNGKTYYSLIERVKIKGKWKYKTLESYGDIPPVKYRPILIKGFAEAELKNLPDHSVNLVIIDPPYGIEYDTDFRKDKPSNLGEIDLDNDKIFSTFPDVARELYRILKPDGALYCFSRWDVTGRFMEILSKYFTLKNRLTWVKNNWSMGDLTGSYAMQTEDIIFCIKGKHKLNNGRSTDVLQFDRVAGNDLKHSHQKPIALLNHLIMKSSNKGDVVLDCYAGSGSTLISAVKLGRKAVGIELTDKYLNLAQERLKDEVFRKNGCIEWQDTLLEKGRVKTSLESEPKGEASQG